MFFIVRMGPFVCYEILFLPNSVWIRFCRVFHSVSPVGHGNLSLVLVFQEGLAGEGRALFHFARRFFSRSRQTKRVGTNVREVFR